MKNQDHRSGDVTPAQRAALYAAKQRLSRTPYSRQGLLQCLEQDGYAPLDAAYAADHCGADWERQAVRCVRLYLSERPFPLRQLLAQLMEAGFTESQARYGASKNGY